jgi:pilus assembly protein CpaB
MNFIKNRTVLGILCIVLSLLICFVLTPLFNQSVSQKASIVRVARDIKSGDQITKDMVQTVEVGGYNLPENVIRQSEKVVGKYAKADFSSGDYILPAKLSDIPASENAYLYSLNGEKQAISVSIKNFAGGLSGKLISGDIVSVIAPDYKKQGSTVIPPELTYVEVIGVTASSGYDTDAEQASGDKEQENEKQLPATVTLLVSPEQAKILAELESEGKLHLSLVYRGSKESTTKFTAIQDKVLETMYPKVLQNQSGNTPNANGSTSGTANTSGSSEPVAQPQNTTLESEGR